MLEAKIIDRGRGPEVAGTRITVYDVLDCHKLGFERIEQLIQTRPERFDAPSRLAVRSIHA
jgi:hypothetical protein